MREDLELLFLLELRFLTGAALERGATLVRLSNDWSRSQADIDSAYPQRGVAPDSWEQRQERDQRFNEAVARLVATQGPFFAELEGFLGLWGRISLILFPQGEVKHPARADRAIQLRRVVGINEDDQLANRTLRNKWLHFDEIIDEYEAAGASRPSPQRFTTSSRLTQHERDTTLRLVIVDLMQVEYAGVGVFRLQEMIGSLVNLQARVESAIQSWGERTVRVDSA